MENLDGVLSEKLHLDLYFVYIQYWMEIKIIEKVCPQETF